MTCDMSSKNASLYCKSFNHSRCLPSPKYPRGMRASFERSTSSAPIFSGTNDATLGRAQSSRSLTAKVGKSILHFLFISNTASVSRNATPPVASTSYSHHGTSTKLTPPISTSILTIVPAEPSAVTSAKQPSNRRQKTIRITPPTTPSANRRAKAIGQSEVVRISSSSPSPTQHPKPRNSVCQARSAIHIATPPPVSTSTSALAAPSSSPPTMFTVPIPHNLQKTSAKVVAFCSPPLDPPSSSLSVHSQSPCSKSTPTLHSRFTYISVL